jgi:hypothetical protein
MTKEDVKRIKQAMGNYLKGTFVCQGVSAKGQEYINYINELEEKTKHLERKLIKLAKKNLRLQNENEHLTSEACYAYGAFANAEQGVAQIFSEMLFDEIEQDKTVLNESQKEWLKQTLDKLLKKFGAFDENAHYYEVTPALTGVPLYVASEEEETVESMKMKLSIRGEIELTEISKSEYARYENED